jgi:hypothetical protein
MLCIVFRCAECRILLMVMLSVFMLNVIMLSFIMLNVLMLSVLKLNVLMLNVLMLSVIMLNVIMLSVMAPCKGTTAKETSNRSVRLVLCVTSIKFYLYSHSLFIF